MRYTKDVLQKLLDLNEGFEKTKSFVGRNFKETNHYLIKGGKLFVRSKGKSSWADSHHDNFTIADIDKTRRFLKDVIDELKTEGIK
ncbi:hypothetical protein QNH47_10305 [Virgibacillus halodenitrificans]|uniref:hypothetical protein n=1 Tax=Virgibacillus halodenitrificans TaxID=1482 RepID=UPI0024C04D6A|nr:hypothetical protein [Virgibacillus halodenitrificans]WHX24587.1 hypothetical protein QNH47_10305 [Virgibacillus halodenitrificans]